MKPFAFNRAKQTNHFINQNLETMKYIAYYRVSTKKQKASGLGLEAQRNIINTFTKDQTILAEYTDIETGTRKGNDRQELKKAIAEAIKNNAVLIIARLDRLSRNVSFITALMESEVDFVACDMPQANKFTIHIFAALAEQEAELISKRTKDALKVLKRSGKALGSPENLTAEAMKIGLITRQQNALENENNKKATALIVSLKNEGNTFFFIAQELNRLGFKTRRNKEFQQIQVQRLYDRYSSNLKMPIPS